jgi:hypothetical protein
MNPDVQRNPLAKATLPIQPGQIMPGGAMRIPLPQAPAGARYAMFMINLANDQGVQATMDFVQVPLDVEARPTLQSFTPSPSAGTVRFNFSTIADRAYRIQQADDLRSSFFDVFTEIVGDGSDVEVTIPIMPASQAFWRIMVVPD